MIKFFKKYYPPFVFVCGLLTVFFIFSLAILLTKALVFGLFIGFLVTSFFGGMIFFALRSMRVRRVLDKSGVKVEEDFILFDGDEKLILSADGIQVPFKLSSPTAILKAKEKSLEHVFVNWSEIMSWEIRTEGHVYETTYLSSIKRTAPLVLREKEFIAKVLSELSCPVKVCTDSFKG